MTDLDPDTQKLYARIEARAGRRLTQAELQRRAARSETQEWLTNPPSERWRQQHTVTVEQLSTHMQDISVRAEGSAVVLHCERDGCGWASSWGDVTGRAAFSSVFTRAIDHGALCRHPIP
jgi:hypothetical protein